MERKMRLAAPGLSQLCDDLGGLEQCCSKDRGRTERKRSPQVCRTQQLDPRARAAMTPVLELMLCSKAGRRLKPDKPGHKTK